MKKTMQNMMQSIKKWSWLMEGCVLAFFLSFLFMSLYGGFGEQESEEFIFYYGVCRNWYSNFVLFLIFLGILLPLKSGNRPWEQHRYCRLPLEAAFLIAIFLVGSRGNVASAAAGVVSGTGANHIAGSFLSHSIAERLAGLSNLLYLTLLYAVAWYLGICLREVRVTGLWGYVKKRSVLYGFFSFIKRKCRTFLHDLTHIDLSQDAKRMIRRIVILNGLLLFVVSSIWVAGYFLVVIYSLFLYFVLKKYVGSLQKKYEVLLSATNEMAQGNLNVTIEEDLGVFEPFRVQVLKIQQGFKKAVEEEVKSQRMKTELITNVSHDLKTPLTAIITYIGLLKEEGLSRGQREEYLSTLERKSLRLKVLIEDLFEVSKAASRAVKLEIMDVDIVNLIKQAQLEMSEKLEDAGLEVRLLLPKEKIILPLDSQKTFRIYENLFANIAKYALSGTRVYVTAQAGQDTFTVTLKNISAQEIRIDPKELTERFVRGDASRNTEGSGLGLAIAKSFTELQNGRLTLEVDGDLFKVITTWPLKK